MKTRRRVPPPKPVVKFGDLKIGEVFSFEQILFLKVRIGATEPRTTAVGLTTGVECSMYSETRIALVDGEYVYED